MQEPLWLQYRRTAKLDDIRGQGHVVKPLRTFLQSPYSRAMLFEGETGTGKTLMAHALAHELGIDPQYAFYSLASGECTAQRVRDVLNSCHLTPMFGSRWKMVCVNECDRMTAGADTVWLDGLEESLPNTLIIFTTNNARALSTRFLDRCERYVFEADIGKLRKSAQRLVDETWMRVLGHNHSPTLKDLGCDFKHGFLSFRDVIQRLEPRIRQQLQEG